MLRRGTLAASLLIVALGATFGVASGCAKAGETPCQFNSDCSVGYCGPDGTCQKNCVDSERDCPSGFVCDQNAQCVPRGQGGGGPGGSNAGGTNAGGSNPGGAGPSAGGGGSTPGASSSSGAGAGASTSASSGTGGSGNKHELDLCTGDAQCASPLICRSMTPSGTKRCTRSCGSHADCMTATRCVPVGAEHYCTATDTGRSCSQAAQCNFACLTSQQYCTNTCDSGSDCPNGYGCMGVGSPAVFVCVKDEAACDPSTDTSACIAAAACDVSATMVVGGCTSLCRSAADCPRRAAGLAAWTCPGGTPQNPGLCTRPGDVAGPLETGSDPSQWACNGSGTVVDVCNDGLHIDFDQFIIPNPPTGVSCSATTTHDGVAGDACVDSCRYQGACPFGSACVAIGSVVSGARAGLCLPTGGGEVGASCSHDRDCVFGYCLTGGVCSRDCTADGVCPGGTTCTAGSAPTVEGQTFRRCE